MRISSLIIGAEKLPYETAEVLNERRASIAVEGAGRNAVIAQWQQRIPPVNER
jgi:hypothetical protein